MATLNLRWFTSESALRAITPTYLVRLLSRHKGYFSKHDFELPDPESAESLDYEAIAKLLMNLDASTPAALIDSLYYVNELATPECMDAVLQAIEDRGLAIDPDQNHTPIDVAIQAWLLEPAILQEKHAEQMLSRPRSYVYFQSHARELPDFSLPPPDQLGGCEAALDAWFEKRRRGTGAKVLVYPKEDGVWFLVRHGHTFRRETSSDKGKPGSVAFRPLRFDVVVYNPTLGELGMNAETEGERSLYRKVFGLHFFGDEEFFRGTGKYTLNPLQTDGRDSLTCTIEEIKSITLKEVHFFRGGAQSEIEMRKAKDVFAAYSARGAALPSQRIIKARFEVVFADSKTPRSVTISPSNRAQYTRDHDSRHIEAWLRECKFIKSREVNRGR